jgi:hypothetical protein
LMLFDRPPFTYPPGVGFPGLCVQVNFVGK